jgi:hypothetical protein
MGRSGATSSTTVSTIPRNRLVPVLIRVMHLIDGGELFTMNNLQEATEYSVALYWSHT